MKKFIIAMTFALIAAALAPASSALAKHGADDPAGHHQGDGSGHP